MGGGKAVAGDAAAGKRARRAEVLGSGREVLAEVVDVGPALGALIERVGVLGLAPSRPALLEDDSLLLGAVERRLWMNLVVRVEVLEELAVELVLAV